MAKAELMEGFLGRWSGTAKTWFEPGTPVMTAPISGHFYKVLKGKSVGYTYATKVHGKTAQGTAIIGRDLATGKLSLCWVDTFHTQSDVMLFAQDQHAVKNGFSVSGKWAVAPDDPPWGWRITYQLKRSGIDITHYIITPDGHESPAIKIALAKGAPKKLPKRGRAR